MLVTGRRKLASEVVMRGDDEVKVGYSGRHVSEERKAREVGAENVSIK